MLRRLLRCQFASAAKVPSGNDTRPSGIEVAGGCSHARYCRRRQHCPSRSLRALRDRRPGAALEGLPQNPVKRCRVCPSAHSPMWIWMTSGISGGVRLKPWRSVSWPNGSPRKAGSRATHNYVVKAIGKDESAGRSSIAACGPAWSICKRYGG